MCPYELQSETTRLFLLHVERALSIMQSCMWQVQTITLYEKVLQVTSLDHHQHLRYTHFFYHWCVISLLTWNLGLRRWLRHQTLFWAKERSCRKLNSVSRWERRLCCCRRETRTFPAWSKLVRCHVDIPVIIVSQFRLLHPLVSFKVESAAFSWKIKYRLRQKLMLFNHHSVWLSAAFKDWRGVGGWCNISM